MATTIIDLPEHIALNARKFHLEIYKQLDNVHPPLIFVEPQTGLAVLSEDQHHQLADTFKCFGLSLPVHVEAKFLINAWSYVVCYLGSLFKLRQSDPGMYQVMSSELSFTERAYIMALVNADKAKVQKLALRLSAFSQPEAYYR